MPVDIGTSGKSTIANGLKGATPASSSGGWGDVLEWLVPAGASLAGGWLSGQAGEAAANADRDAAQANVQLSREVYNDQRNLARPGYLTGGAATNLLGAQFGIGPQNYEAAYAGGGSGGGGTSDGSVALPNFGAGQPVQGHSGGGGGNALTAGLGSSSRISCARIAYPCSAGRMAASRYFGQSDPISSPATTVQTSVRRPCCIQAAEGLATPLGVRAYRP